MKKNRFFEKVGKLTFSIITTAVLVTWVVFAASWDSLGDWDTVSWTNWKNMVDAINAKADISNTINKSDIPTCWSSEALSFNWSSFVCKSTWGWSSTSGDIQLWMVYNNTDANKTINVTFDTPYSVAPKIMASVSWFRLENSSRNESFNVWVNYSNVTTTWFKITLMWSKWSNHKERTQSALWVAIPNKIGTWSSSTSVSHNSSTCYTTGSFNTNSKSWSCVVGAVNNYYTWKSWCFKTIFLPSWWDTDVPWFRYSSRYKQTCN